MSKEKELLDDKTIKKQAQIVGKKFGKKAELDFGAGAEWARLEIMKSYGSLLNKKIVTVGVVSEIKKIIKKLTIRKRAFNKGSKIVEKYGWAINSITNNENRTLIRLNRIKNGQPPFTSKFIGESLGGVWESCVALQIYGNIKK